MDFLERVCEVYGTIFETKEEMFLLGYLVASGGELNLWNEIEHDISLLEKDSEFWLPIIKDFLKTRRKVFDERVKEVKTLLRKKLEEREARIPEWLKLEGMPNPT